MSDQKLMLLSVARINTIAVVAAGGCAGLTPEQQRLIKSQLSRSDLAILWGARELITDLSRQLGTPLEIVIAPEMLTFKPGKYHHDNTTRSRPD